MKIRVGLLGFGYWGPNYARLFSEIPGVQLTHICDVSSERTAGLSERYPTAVITNEPDRILDSPDLDAVVIATPASTHAQLIARALRSGKHVLVEKPITLTTETARSAGRLAKSVGRVLMVGHVFEYNGAVRAAKKYLDDGILGSLFYVYFTRTGLGPIRQDVNVVWDLMPHDVSILSFLLGGEQPVSVSAAGASYLRPGCEDVVFALLRYKSGLLAHIHASWLDPNKARRMTLIGSEKMLVFDDVNTVEPIRIYTKGVSVSPPLAPRSFGDFQVSLRDGDILIPRIDSREPLKVQAEHFIDCIRTGHNPLTDAESGARVVDTCKRIERAIGEHS